MTLAIWTLAASPALDVATRLTAATLLALPIAFFVAAALAARNRFAIPLVLVIATIAAGVWGMSDPAVLALERPLGYANANAALYVQGSAAALLLGIAIGGAAGGSVTAAAIAALLPLAVRSDSKAGVVLCVLVVTTGTLTLTRRWSSAHVATLAGLLVLVAFVATTAYGATYAPAAEAGSTQRLERPIYRGLSERRFDLWHSAIDVAGEHPGRGVGPGRFRAEGFLARTDADRKWAHSLLLQQAAELGVAGAALTLGVGAWVFIRLARVPSRGAAVAAIAAGALAVHGAIDFVAHFSVLLVVIALLVGHAVGSRALRD